MSGFPTFFFFVCADASSSSSSSYDNLQHEAEKTRKGERGNEFNSNWLKSKACDRLMVHEEKTSKKKI